MANELAAGKNSKPDVTLKEAFDIYQKQSDSLHKLWTYFQVVSIAVLGYTVGSDKAQWSVSTYALMSLSYAFFAGSNLWVVLVSQIELKKFSNAIKLAASQSGSIGEKLVVSAVEPWRVGLFHSVSAIVVLAAIWGTWHDKCSGAKVCPKPESAQKAT